MNAKDYALAIEGANVVYDRGLINDVTRVSLINKLLCQAEEAGLKAEVEAARREIYDAALNQIKG